MYIVILPVLNEAETIRKFIFGVHDALAGHPNRIIVIDDGSTDGTLEAVMELKRANVIDLIHRRKSINGCARGKALIDGLRYATLKYADASVFIEMDTDGAHNPHEIHKGLEVLQQGGNIVIGSKYLRESYVSGRGLIRNLISFANTLFLQLLISKEITDYSNGFRVYDRKAAEIAVAHQFKYQTPIYLGEVLVLWLNNKLVVGEFACTYIERKQGTSKVKWTDVWQGLEGVWFIYKQSKHDR